MRKRRFEYKYIDISIVFTRVRIHVDRIHMHFDPINQNILFKEQKYLPKDGKQFLVAS